MRIPVFGRIRDRQEPSRTEPGDRPDAPAITAPTASSLHVDWSFRPSPWHGPISPPDLVAPGSEARVAADTVLFHDCRLSQITLRQQPASDGAWPIALEVQEFEGTYLSLAIELPLEAADGLERRHVIGVRTAIDAGGPLDTYVRLNIRHGPNTEQIVRELSGDEADHVIEFDLAYSRLNERRVQRLWIDLIFESPRMTRAVIRDLTLWRRPRAEL